MGKYKYKVVIYHGELKTIYYVVKEISEDEWEVVDTCRSKRLANYLANNPHMISSQTHEEMERGIKRD